MKFDVCYSWVFRIGLVTLLIAVCRVNANWLYLAISGVSVPSSSGPDGLSTRSTYFPCDSVIGLNDRQLHVCLQQPYAMPSVSFGARNAIIECQWQFQYERWNCTTAKTQNDSQTEVFGSTLRAANKETAFMSAITSSGLVHAITKACSSGNLTECGCDNNYGSGQAMSGPNNEKWHWGGCSDNVKYGMKFSKQFLDRFEREQFRGTKDVRRLMNVHNHDVGREAVSRLLRKQCRCHGVSGSCEFKTCWRQLPEFNEVGEVLKSRYDRFAVQIARRGKKRLRRKEKSERKIPIRDSQLVYLNKSPNYCVRNEDMGILGTKDRVCNNTSFGSDSCDLLCCGRGYNTREEVRLERCKCKFVWCCYVKCRTCRSVVKVYTCK